MTERDVQGEAAPEADVYEQRVPVTDDETVDDDAARDPEEPESATVDLPPHLPSEADPADAYEQTQAVEYDEDDYR